jgi:hypothetical protein
MLFDHALEIFTRVQCRNLRVIKRCHLAVKEFEGHFATLGEERRTRLLEQVIVLACLFYQFGGRIDFSHIQNFYMRSLFSKEEEAETDESKILKQIAYQSTEFDDVILGYLRTGMFDSVAISALIEKQTTVSQREVLTQKEREIYKLVWANFHGTGKEFCEKLTSFLDENLHMLAWDDVFQATRTLKLAGFKGDIHKWTDAFIVNRASHFTFEQCQTFAGVAHSLSATKAIQNRRDTILRQRHPKEVIYAMVMNSGWSQEDTATLDAYSIDEYVAWFRAEKDERLLNVLSHFVQTFNPAQSQPEWKAIGEKIFAAFRILCKGDEFIRFKLLNNVKISPQQLGEPPSQPEPPESCNEGR